MFNHVDLNLPHLSRENIDGVRYYSVPLEEELIKLVSITSVTSHKNRQIFINWRKKVGEAQADKITRQSTSRGTDMHTLTECYLKNEDLPKKVWISRQKANKRKITNFDEIKPILEKYNFAVIEFEDFSFKDNIIRAHNCEVIGGVHGAGLTNMIFMKKKSKVIEIRSDGDDSNNCFFSLASDMEHDYFYFLANPTSKNFYETDLHVDPVLFDNFLKNNRF